jgi:4-amino-4-deoxy-L-arabinose transferase
MNNIYFGLLVFLFCTSGLYFSWKFDSDNKIVLSILLLVICGIIVRIYTSADFFLHDWDERYHALVAKNLIKQPLIPQLYSNPVLPYDYKNWGSNHIWLHKQPLPLWCISLSLWIFGINEFSVRLPSIILSSLGIIITYYIAHYFYNSRVAYIAALLYSINGLNISLVSGHDPTDHIDIFFLFFISSAVLLAIEFVKSKNQILNLLTGISIGMAVLSKWLPAFIVFPIWFLLVFDSRKFKLKEIIISFSILLIVSLAVFLPWQFYIFHQFPLEAKWEAGINIKHITENLEGHGRSYWYHFIQLGQLYGELVYLPIIWFIYKTLTHFLNYKRLLILIWFLVPLFFFSIVKTKMPAYTLFSSPSIFIIIGLFFVYLKAHIRKFKYKIIPIILLILLIALPVRLCIVQTRMFKKYNRTQEWVTDIKKLEPLSKQYNGKLIIFNTDRPIETMFYIDCIAYSIIPEKEKILELEQEGYKVLIK